MLSCPEFTATESQKDVSQLSIESHSIALSTATPPATQPLSEQRPFELTCTTTKLEPQLGSANNSPPFYENRILIVQSDEYSIPTRPWFPVAKFPPLEKWRTDNVPSPSFYSDASIPEPVLLVCYPEGKRTPAVPIITPQPDLDNERNYLPQDQQTASGVSLQGMDPPVASPTFDRSERKARTNFTERQRSVLNSYLDTHPYASATDIENLRELTGLSARQIRTYFTNRRMRHSKDVSVAKGRPPAGRPPKEK